MCGTFAGRSHASPGCTCISRIQGVYCKRLRASAELTARELLCRISRIIYERLHLPRIIYAWLHLTWVT
eukprot:scaffold48732_cov26-Tisochrysis_lutea.AAC.1